MRALPLYGSYIGPFVSNAIEGFDDDALSSDDYSLPDPDEHDFAPLPDERATTRRRNADSYRWR